MCRRGFYNGRCLLVPSFFLMSRPLGDPGLCDGHTFHGFLRVDLQISPVKLLVGFLLPCVLQCFVEVGAHFFIHVTANSATAFMCQRAFYGTFANRRSTVL